MPFCWLAQGYVVTLINFRGSTGDAAGEEFAQIAWGNWGDVSCGGCKKCHRIHDQERIYRQKQAGDRRRFFRCVFRREVPGRPKPVVRTIGISAPLFSTLASTIRLISLPQMLTGCRKRTLMRRPGHRHRHRCGTNSKKRVQSCIRMNTPHRRFLHMARVICVCRGGRVLSCTGH